jgi:hypothetical protein
MQGNIVMHLTQIAGELQVVLDIDDNEEAKALSERMGKYKLVQHGPSIFVYDREDNTLLSHYNPFDNTQLICSSNGFTLANEFGAKRFLTLNARAAVSEAHAAEAKPEKFARDRSFPLNTSQEIDSAFTVVTLEKLLEIRQRNASQLYDDFANLFDRCADFIPEKQAEYLSGGKKQDKFCRFNMENHPAKDGIITDQIFLLDKENKIIGTISATVCTARDGAVDVYLYDEIVDYFSRIDPASEIMKELQSLYDNDQLLKDEKNAEIAKIIEPVRLGLMKPLFAAVTQQIRSTIRTLLPNLSESDLDDKIANGSVRAFIRAADKRVSSYEALHCGTENEGYYVIHGRPTLLAKLVDTYVKEIWAEAKLRELTSLSDDVRTNVIDGVDSKQGLTNTPSSMFHHNAAASAVVGSQSALGVPDPDVRRTY